MPRQPSGVAAIHIEKFRFASYRDGCTPFRHSLRSLSFFSWFCGTHGRRRHFGETPKEAASPSQSVHGERLGGGLPLSPPPPSHQAASTLGRGRSCSLRVFRYAPASPLHSLPALVDNQKTQNQNQKQKKLIKTKSSKIKQKSKN